MIGVDCVSVSRGWVSDPDRQERKMVEDPRMSDEVGYRWRTSGGGSD